MHFLLKKLKLLEYVSHVIVSHGIGRERQITLAGTCKAVRSMFWSFVAKKIKEINIKRKKSNLHLITSHCQKNLSHTVLSRDR